ncbi:hypothetical protein CERSUDRAFT_133735 [Gelatoporia subvermispora B]|uniref:ENTH domain-containing protein n=1 Tax=Ceriporiopsis subvermispora (strain B) TaxID=914234 RepID=M2PR27_CERS8|nr:hypothetical protein CERSUDRAFT_133735 [Gelatoporia subvermispora B]
MTSFEKTVKLACKPKAAPPKAKYLDPIIAATWSEDGAVHDVCKALAPRFREPNVIVVFKALIVLHTIIRNGATDNVLQYLSSSDVLKLRNVSAGNWEGYNTPQSLQNYSTYLDTRIRSYRDLKHDAIRVQSENNRDLRNSAAVDEDRVEQQSSTRKRGKTLPTSAAASSVSRSKTIAGRKLRVMTVEKGLLRETKIVQKMIDALCECRFYLDDLEDELNITALRMLVKDLLILFQALNEGVINVLEHYFEMSHIDAEEALGIYRHFCKETERVVEYLGVAKKLQNLLNVPIPNLRHAPVSLAGSLEEYLNDPNFEQNRIEYKTNKEAADRNVKLGVKAGTSKPPDKEASKPSTSQAAEPPLQDNAAKTPGGQALIDFFTSIEQEQQTMFNPQTGSPTSTYFQQQAQHNPFAQMQQQGAPFGAPSFAQAQLQMQPTGFVMPQQTSFQIPPQPTSTNPFGQQPPPQQAGPFQQPFLQAQPTGFLQPQATGANPFRQSMFAPQQTGMSPFGLGGPTQQQPGSNPFPAQVQQQPQQQPQSSNMNPFPSYQAQDQSSQPQHSMFGQQLQTSPTGAPPFGFLNSTPGQASSAFPSIASPAAAQPFAVPGSQGPQRPSTAPLSAPSSTASSGPPEAQFVKTHQTGSRNPFGVPVTPAPPVPKPPTLFQLAAGGQNGPISTQPGQQQQQQPSSSGLAPQATGFNAFSSPAGQSTMANVASSFSFNKPNGSTGGFGSSAQPSSPTGTSTSIFSDTLFSSLSSQPTGASALSSTLSTSGAPSLNVPIPSGSLMPQTTGFAGIKPFKPSSSFGAALLESLPPIPQSPSESPQPQPNGAQQTGGFGGLSGGGLGSGLRPQATGLAGTGNPFRATMFALPSAGSGGVSGGLGNAPSFMGSQPGALGNTPTGLPSFQPSSSFGANLFGSGPGAGADPSKQQQQQQNGTASLI